PDTLVLAPAAARLRIRYLDAPGAWVGAWDSEAAGRLPLAVELSIATVPGVAVPPGQALACAPEMVVPIGGAGRGGAWFPHRAAAAGAAGGAATTRAGPARDARRPP